MADATRRGAGDRWLAGEAVDGVDFALHAPVEIGLGRHEGRRGRVALLLALGDDPVYLVALSGQGGEARVRQSALRALG